MKRIFLFVVPMLFAAMVFGQQPSDVMGQPGPLRFNDQAFGLVTSNSPSQGYFLQEYMPAGDTLEHHHSLLSLHLFATELTAEEASRQKLAELDEYKNTDPLCNFQELKSPDGKEFVVDFIKSTRGEYSCKK